MHHLPLLVTLTAGLGTALIFGYITHRIGLSSIVGYLLAGIAIGPYSPWASSGYVADRALAEQMAEIGVIMLMFGVGLHFHLDQLLAVRRVALPGAVGQSLVATLIGVGVVVTAFAWDTSAGVIFGLALSVARTVVLMRILSENNDLHTRAGHIAVGWLVVEDLFTVVVLVLLPAIFGSVSGHEESQSVGVALGMAAVKIAALVAVTFFIGGRVIPFLLKQVAATRSRELFTLSVLVLALGLAVSSAMFFGVSMALGAFLGGMVVGRSDFSHRAASDALPMSSAFAVVFFVSIGMLFDPKFLLAEPALVAATLGIVLLCKPLTALAIVAFMGYPVKVALSVAVALAQIGEFSFILAKLGNDLSILPIVGTNALIAAAIVSITVNPLLYRAVGPMEKWLAKHPKLWSKLNARAQRAGQTPGAAEMPVQPEDPAHRAVIIGYGPVGRTVARLLRENDVLPTVIELNLDTVAKLRAEGTPAVYGDATHRETLEAAEIAKADTLVLSAPMQTGEEVIRLAKEMNPRVRVLARADYVKSMPALKHVGADRVYSGEGEIAIAMSLSVLRALGATPEQIDRERDRVRAELTGD